MRLYHVNRPENYGFASGMCRYHNKNSTVLMLHDLRAQKENENQYIQNNNFADCFVLV